MNKSKKILFGISTLFVLLLSSILISCDMLGLSKTGSVLINLSNDDVATKTMVPDLSMEIDSYTIIGSGPNGASFSESISLVSTYSKTDLVEGSWTITVNAYNGDSSPTLIASGSTNVSITRGEVRVASVTVVPISGTGNLDITVDWDDTLDTPTLEFELYDSNNDLVSVNDSFSIDNQIGSLSIDNLDTGYYLLNITLKENGSPIGFTIDALRIIDSQVTVGNLSIIVDDTGDLSLNLTQQMDNPIDVTLNNVSSVLTLENDMVVVATTSETVDSYSWYLNGLLLSGETSDTITIGSQLYEGEYQLTCVVYKGNIISSSTESFTVTESQIVILDNGFGATTSTYPQGSGIYSTVSTLFGPEYRLADYSDFVAFVDGGGDILELFNQLGLSITGDSGWVSRNGYLNYDSLRNYYLARLDGTPPPEFLLIESLSNNDVVLSAINAVDMKILTKRTTVPIGIVTGQITDAMTGMGIGGVIISLVEGGPPLTITDPNGDFSIPLPGGMIHTLFFMLPGYNFEDYTLYVTPDLTTIIPASTIVGNPEITNTDALRIVLTWGEVPYDLDSHLVTPDGNHIFYQALSIVGCTANLDIDDTTSYGPETITIDPVNNIGIYKYYIHNFSEGPSITTSSAIVKVYDSTGLIHTYNVPTTGDGLYWSVFDIVNGAIVQINAIQTTEPSNAPAP